MCTVFAKNKTALLLGHLVQGKLGDAAFGGGVMNLEVLGLHVFQPKRLGRPSLVEHNERRILVVEVDAPVELVAASLQRPTERSVVAESPLTDHNGHAADFAVRAMEAGEEMEP